MNDVRYNQSEGNSSKLKENLKMNKNELISKIKTMSADKIEKLITLLIREGILSGEPSRPASLTLSE